MKAESFNTNEWPYRWLSSFLLSTVRQLGQRRQHLADQTHDVALLCTLHLQITVHVAERRMKRPKPPCPVVPVGSRWKG